MNSDSSMPAGEINPLDVACPSCQARPGDQCGHEWGNGRWVRHKNPHDARVVRAHNVCPACGERANHFDPALGVAGEWTCVAVQYGACRPFRAARQETTDEES